MYVHRENALHHEIREYEVDTHLRLISQKDYMEGDNHDIIATDSQKNTVYLMAKKHGIRSPEEFALLLCSHFLYTYEQVAEVSINVEEYPWTRHYVYNVPHNHAFVMSPTATRYCQVSQLRNGMNYIYIKKKKKVYIGRILASFSLYSDKTDSKHWNEMERLDNHIKLRVKN